MRTFCLLCWVACGLALVSGVNGIARGQEPNLSKQEASDALEYANAGEHEKALRALGNIVDRGVSSQDIFRTPLPMAVAALNRVLSYETADQRYDWLKAWTFPADSRDSVRLLSCPTPMIAPPKSFARTIGQRPRDNIFALAETGGVEGWFCSAWILIQAADELGRLGRLISELEPLVESDVPNAERLLEIVTAAYQRSDPQSVKSRLEESSHPAEEGQPGVDFHLVSLALVGSGRSELAVASTAALSAMVDRAGGLRASLQRLHAMTVQRHLGKSPMQSLEEDQLKYWVADRGQAAFASRHGMPAPLWLAHEDHVLHLAGTQSDTLYCRFPLAGEFEFLCETQTGGPTPRHSGLVYGGMHFALNPANQELVVSDGKQLTIEKRHCPFARTDESPLFNRVSIRGAESKTHFEVNLHPMWQFERDSVQANPWLGLRVQGASRGLFRNLTMVGEPTIPRSVELLSDDGLLGWSSEFSSSAANWSVHEKTLIGSSREGEQPGPELLQYERPLLSGETIGYRFWMPKTASADGQIASVHPVLGRLAFLLLSDGVRVRWLTDAAPDWTGLPSDHSVLEPLSRRGPKPLPVRSDEWNLVQLTRHQDSVELKLNDELVYVRKVDYDGSRRFGFLRESLASEVKVDQVTLTGDWPETLPDDFREDMLAPLTPINTRGDEAAKLKTGQHFSDQTLALNSLALRRKAGGKAPIERAELLADWIFPDPFHDDVRFDGFFVPTFASPTVLGDPAFASHTEATLDCLPTLRAPLLDWFALVQTHFPDQLAARISGIDEDRSPISRAGKLALLVLDALSKDHVQVAETQIAKLQQMITGEPLVADPDKTMWLELLTAASALDAIPSSRVGAEFVGLVIQRQTESRSWAEHVDVQSQLLSLRGKLNTSGRRQTQDTLVPDELSGPWIATSDFNEQSCGEGRPLPVWQRNGLGDVVHTSGHRMDYLLFGMPLTQPFTVMGEMRPRAACQFLLGGEYIGAGSRNDNFELGAVRQPRQFVSVEKPWDAPKESVHYRSQMSADALQTFLSGRLVRERSPSEVADPWLALRSSWRLNGWFRDVSVACDKPSGRNQSIRLIDNKGLSGWHPYHGASLTTDDGHWRLRDDEAAATLSGAKREMPTQAAMEKLLQYRCPLVEDGEFEFDFLIGEDPKQFAAGPAIGRLALLIADQGIAEHWITDGGFDRTRVRPGAVTLDPSHQVGDSGLGLEAGKYHRVRLEVRADQLKLYVKGHLVFERPLPIATGRKLGIFHFADRQEVRIREATLRLGQAAYPDLPGDTLANPVVTELDRWSRTLPDHFFRAFDVSTADDPCFVDLGPSQTGVIDDHPDGRFVSAISDGKWVQKVLGAKFTISGDFDVEASYSDLQARQAVKNKNAMLTISLNDDFSRRLAATIGHDQRFGHELKGVITLHHPNNTKSYLSDRTTDESTSGRLRIARQGKIVYVLMAPGDSPRYRLISTQEASTADVPLEAIQLMTVCNGGGMASVVWNDFSIRAERLRYPGPDINQEISRVGVIDLATGNGTKLADPVPPYTHVGSLAWRPDGKYVVYDQSSGSTQDSRLMMMAVAGGQPVDIGFGSMPNFSPDGKQIAFSAAGQGVGVMTVSEDGRQVSDRRILNRYGWGLQWSGDGGTLAYSRGGNITLHDLRTGSDRVLMTDEAATRYSYVYWNMAWSRDSSRIAFKARRRNNLPDEIAVVELANPDRLDVLVPDATGVNPDISWTPDNQGLMVTARRTGDRSPMLYRIDLDRAEDWHRLDNIPETWEISHGDWSPNGKSIGVSGKQQSELLEWENGAVF